MVIFETPEAFARGIAERAPAMRRIAHLASNIVRPPRDLFGWVETVRRTDGTEETVRCKFAGYVPHELRRPEDGEAGTVELDGETVSFVEDLAPYLAFRMKLIPVDQILRIAYTVDQSPRGETLRHLSIQYIAPARVSQADAVAAQDELFAQQTPLVQVFFPSARLGGKIGARLTAGTPWEYRDDSLPRDVRAVGWRTPLVFDFVIAHDLTEREVGRTPVRLYGPDGRPL